METKISRRTFFKAAAAGSAGALVYGVGQQARFGDASGEAAASRIEQWVPTVCLMCPGSCGVLVRIMDGRAIKIEGNPLHPINKGKVCPKANAGLQVLYDPDRIRGPMKQVGQRGSGRWQQITWDEAITTVTERLRVLREAGEPHTFAFMNGRLRGQMEGLIARFCQVFGTPNDIGHHSVCIDGVRIANYLAHGWRELAAYDWDNCNYVLSFGRAFLEASRPTVRQLRAFGYMRRDRPNRRAKFVQVEPRLSVTAAKADEWIPIKPGTDGALALGIAHVLISQGLHDADFVAMYTHGFDDWTDANGVTHMGFRTLVLRDYNPRRVADITGVPPETIVRIAREFATTLPAISAGGGGTSMQTNGVYTRMAIHALNALVGSIEVPGGVLTQRQPPFTPWPDVSLDAVAEEGLAMPRIDYAGTRQFPLARSVYQGLPERILSDDPYKLNVLFLYYTNPLFSSPAIGRFYQAFQKVPFIVSFSPFLDDSSVFADLILPDHTYLERWQDDEIDPSLGYPVVGIRRPVVAPLYDTMHTGDVLVRIARALGGSVAESFPWASFEEVLQYRLAGLWAAERGSVRGTEFAYFWQELSDRGLWDDPPYVFGQWSRVFTTPSGKFEFYSRNLEGRLRELAEAEAKAAGTTPEHELEAMLRDLQVEARGDEVFLPHFEAPRYAGNEEEYPFHLNTYKLMAHAEGRGANSPWLQEKLGVHVKKRWNTWAEISPGVAKRMGISDGDWIWLESPLGERIKVRAVLYEGTRPDTVNVPFEQGHRAYGRWANDRGANPNWLIADEYDRLGGLAARFATRVRIYRV